MSMNFQEALDLSLRIREESGYTMYIENVGLDPNGRNVRMRDQTTGQVYYFYSPEAWERLKEEQGWQIRQSWSEEARGEQL